MNIEITIVFGIISLLIGVIGFFGGKQIQAKNDGASFESVRKDTEYTRRDVAEIKDILKENDQSNKKSIKGVHLRIDKHLREDHGLTISSWEE